MSSTAIASTVKAVPRLPPLPSVRNILKLYNLRALRQLSQNFLLDPSITDQIVATAGRIHGQNVCEIGPGVGSITRSLMRQRPNRLVIVEKDRRFMPMLQQLQAVCYKFCTLIICLKDVRDFNFEKNFPDVRRIPWTDGTVPNLHLIGNLPFSISTSLVVSYLEAMTTRTAAWSFGRTPMTLTFQKEVAERIVATPGEPHRCRLSVMCQLYCDVEHAFNISGGAFVPRPKVDVGVVKFEPLIHPLTQLPFKMVEKVMRTIFNVKNKPVYFTVSRLFPEKLRAELTMKLFRLSDVDENLTATQITNMDLVRLLYAYNVIVEELPTVAHYDFTASRDSRLIAESCF